MRLTRRQMILGMLGMGAGASLPLGRLGRALAGEEEQGFDADQHRALTAACERILPGATQAGVPAHIDYWMARHPFDRFVAPMFRVGAVHLDRLAREAHQRPFATCKPEQQDAILKRFQLGEIQARKFQSKPFFEHLVRFTMEGFLGDPKYGGNRDEIGWKFIGRCQCWWQPRKLDMIRNPKGGLPW